MKEKDYQIYTHTDTQFEIFKNVIELCNECTSELCWHIREALSQEAVIRWSLE